MEHMNADVRRKALNEYIERTRRILELSSPPLEKIHNAEDYRIYLQRSFQRIGELGRENIATLKKYLYPLLQMGASMTEDEIESLRDFSSMLIDTTNMENLDMPLLYIQAKRILESAEQNHDRRALILAEDSMVIAAYMMVNLSIRLFPEINDCFRYRDVGLGAAERLLEHLEPENFATLPDDECRELVLINARYIRCLFEWDDRMDKEVANDYDLRLMRRALALAEDPFYREAMPEYRWDTHVFRTLQYLADFTENHNKHGFNEEQVKEIYQYTLRLIDFLETHPDLEEGCPKVEQDFYLARNAFFAGKMTLEEYRDSLLHIIEQMDRNDFSARGLFVCFTAPLEYMITLDKDNLSTEQKEVLRATYEDIAAYTYHMPKTGVLSFMLTFLADFLKQYIEIPGGVPFQNMCLQIMAAMHPPTYVHTMNVAAIARYLAGQVLAREPERFLGLAGADDLATLEEKRTAVLDHIYNAALMHDIGKLFIVETIMTYGRDLTDAEWTFVKSHTLVGAALLERFPGTAPYAEVALLHHRWYDDSQGYPEKKSLDQASCKTVIDLVSVADSLDAATDTIGRSYKDGTSLEGYVEELREGKGTRYAPYIVDLFDDADVLAKLNTLLTEGRDENYRSTYRLLKNLLEKRKPARNPEDGQEIEHLRKELHDLQARYDFLLAAVDHLPNPIFLKDKDARFFFFNKAYSDFFNMKRDDYIGKTVLDLDYLPQEDRERFQSEDLKRISGLDIVSYDTVFQTADGIDHPSYYWSRGFRDDVSGSQGLAGEIVDISKERALQKSLDSALAELKSSHEKLRAVAEIDHVSGLYNRSVLWDKGKELVGEDAGPFPHACMIMVDLDHFKDVNDKFGHLKGDETLALFATILRKECRPSDLPVRYGGDEFLVILNNIELKNAIRVAERIRARSEKELTLPEGGHITISIGVVEINPSEDFEKNLSRLDKHLYEAKARGRNCVVSSL